MRAVALGAHLENWTYRLVPMARGCDIQLINLYHYGMWYDAIYAMDKSNCDVIVRGYVDELHRVS